MTWDSAYDVPEIKAKNRTLGHVLIIDPHPHNMPSGRKLIAAEAPAPVQGPLRGKP